MAYKILGIKGYDNNSLTYTVPNSATSAIVSKVTVKVEEYWDLPSGKVSASDGSTSADLLAFSLGSNESVHLTGGFTLSAGQSITVANSSGNSNSSFSVTIFGSEE